MSSQQETHSVFKDVLIVLSVSGVSFLNSFFSGALTASLPTIQKDLNISSANLQWSVSLYSLVLGAFLLPAGRLADIFGPKLLFLIGTTLFSGISIAIALSPSWEYFSIFSAILGLGAASNIPSGLAILGNHFSAGAAKNRAFASLGAGQPLGFIGGLVVGALLAETKLSWRASFYIQSALAIALAVIGYFTIPSTSASKKLATSLTNLEVSDASMETIVNHPIISEQEDNKQMDWIGALLSISGLVIFTFALTDAQATPQGWRSPFLPPLIPLSIFLLIGFYYWELRLHRFSIEYYSKSVEDRSGKAPAPPLLSPEIWKSPHLIEILAIVFMGWSGFNTLSYYLNLILQLVLKASPIKTALYFLPMILSGTIYNLVPGFLLGRVNAKPLVIISMLMSLIGPVCMSFITQHTSYWRYIFPAMVFLPSVDILYAIATVQISRSVSRSQQATAGALFGVTTRLATAASLSFVSTFSLQASTSYLQNNLLDSNSQINTAEGPEVLMVGYKVAAYLCLGFLAVGAILSIVLLRGIGIIGKHDEEVQAGLELNSLGDERLTRRRGTRVEGEDSIS